MKQTLAVPKRKSRRPVKVVNLNRAELIHDLRKQGLSTRKAVAQVAEEIGHESTRVLHRTYARWKPDLLELDKANAGEVELSLEEEEILNGTPSPALKARFELEGGLELPKTRNP